MAALTIPSANVLLIIDMETASGGTISSPSPPMQTYLLPIPPGQTAAQVAVDFANEQKFSVGTIAVMIDLSVATPTLKGFTLASSWVAD